MNKLAVFIILILLFGFSCEKNDRQETSVPIHEGMSGLDLVRDPDSKLVKITTGYEFDTAGLPCWVDGVLYFTNNNLKETEISCVISMDASGNYSIVRTDNGVTVSIYLNSAGNFFCCEMFGHRVVEMDKNGNVIRVVAGEYNGKRIDGPNDMVMDSNGGLYFSDSQFIGDAKKMQDTPAVYYVKSDGSVIRVIEDIKFPNGIELSPDGKTLYIANTLGKYLRAYDVQDDGTMTGGRDFAELELTPENKESGVSGADGMAVDSAGNIYVVTTKGLGIQVFNNRGAKLGNIPCAAVTNNCSFGGEDLKTLYVSAKDGIYKMPMKIAGLKIQPI